MPAASTFASTDIAASHRPLRREAAIAAATATAANVGVWIVGRTADVSFLVRTPGADAATEVDLVAVVLTTVLAFAAGVGLFALARRRSDRRANSVVAAGLVVAVGSAGGALWVAEEASTGLLLATMHVLTGAAFAVTMARARRRASGPRLEPDGRG